MDKQVIRVLLVDDHAVVRQGYRTLLQKHDDIQVVGEAADANEALLACRDCAPDVAIMDITMPGQSGIEAIARIKQRYRRLRCLVFTMHNSSVFAHQAFRAGALGYVTKSSAPEVLIRAVYDVHAGRHALSPDIAQILAVTKLQGEYGPLDSLSPREFEILRALASGRCTAEIASDLHISPKTVANCHYEIKRKLDLKSDIDLVHLALRLQVVDLLSITG